MQRTKNDLLPAQLYLPAAQTGLRTALLHHRAYLVAKRDYIAVTSLILWKGTLSPFHPAKRRRESYGAAAIRQRPQLLNLRHKYKMGVPDKQRSLISFPFTFKHRARKRDTRKARLSVSPKSTLHMQTASQGTAEVSSIDTPQ